MMQAVLGSAEDLDMFSSTADAFDIQSAPARMMTLLDMIQRHCGDQRFTPVKVFGDGEFLCFAYPCLIPQVARANLKALCNLIDIAKQPIQGAAALEFTQAVKNKARAYLPAGSNAISFISAAAKHRIPFKQLDRRFWAFGYGKSTSIFNSSITERDSATGVGVAKSKFLSNKLLRDSGIPVADQVKVWSLEHTIASAESMGYPVVLKPENEDGGRGVCPNIQTEAELVGIYKNLKGRFPNLLLEKHLPGDGYRVYVLDNEVVRVRRLQAAHVIGDGTNDIQRLIAIENASPARHAINASMKTISIDRELKSTLAKQGFNLASIPDAKQKVVLSPTTNLSRGGTSTDYIDEMHSSNKRLCIEIAQILGLYCCGIDLISNNASRPLAENGGIVCEVNAQPQIGSVGGVRMHEDMILKAVCSRPPIDLVIDGQADETTQNVFNKAADRLCVRSDVESLLRNGCPVQYFDRLKVSTNVTASDRARLEKLLISVPPNLPSA